MKATTLAVILLLSLPFTGMAQEVIMKKDVGDIRKNIPKYGPNRRHFVHVYFDYKFFASPTDGDAVSIKYLRSSAYTFGLRYKLKVKGFLQAGANLEYWGEDYSLKQNNKKQIPTATIHENETLTYNNIGSEIFLRFNLGEQGNEIGTFIDFGGFGSWVAGANHTFEDELNNSPYMGKTREVKYTNLQYVQDFSYGGRFRFGYNQWVLSASYRIADYFNETFTTELPRFSVGVQVGLHR